MIFAIVYAYVICVLDQGIAMAETWYVPEDVWNILCQSSLRRMTRTVSMHMGKRGFILTAYSRTMLIPFYYLAVQRDLD